MADPIFSLIQVICILGILTFLWKSNPLFKFVLSTFVGFTVAHIFITVIPHMTSSFESVGAGDILTIIPIAVGLLSLTRLSKKYLWVNRYTIAMILGTGLGLNIRSEVAKIFVNLGAVIVPLTSIENIVLVLAFICPLIYFIFTRKEGGLLKYPAQAGRYLFMMWVGIIYANVLVSRTAYLSGAIEQVLVAIGISVG